jgi:putative methionine-R-sulfoxide reductase with GAF domain
MSEAADEIAEIALTVGSRRKFDIPILSSESSNGGNAQQRQPSNQPLIAASTGPDAPDPVDGEIVKITTRARVGPRLLLRRLREVMAEPVTAQARLDRIVVLIASNMVAEVCSLYVVRADGVMELFATEGLDREAVHLTKLEPGEGLVGLIASSAEPLSLSDAQHHPAFSYKPETGEEIYQSFLGVPVLRSGATIGVLVVQNRVPRTYSDEEVEALQTTAMLLAEMIASGELQEMATQVGPIAVRREKLPEPVSNVESPWSYDWTASQRVAAVAGAQNLPFYPHFSSEDDHRRALEACRVGGERLLKALRGGRYNARPEYGEALEYYLDDLPKTAGAGNILLANDQVRILHAMFLADAASLPEGFAGRLKSVIANQFALNAFYDLVQRHNEAVSAGNWAQPFPIDAAKGFFGAVEDNTPRWFEREVEQGLRQVEQAEPPPVPTPERAAVSAIEPPPLPPGTPDAQDSWKRQMATAANALWETFLQGRDMPVAQDEWRAAAEQLGAHVRPIIDFLREQERPLKQ